MSNKLVIASIVLLGLIVATVVAVNARNVDYKPAAAVAEVKLPKIAEDKIDEIEVSGPDQPRTKLAKKGAEWRVVEPVDAAADQDAAKTAAKKIAELKLVQVTATKKENHAALEVTEDKATHVIARSEGKTVLDGYLGSYSSNSTMLRLNGQDTVVGVDGSVRYAFRKQTKDYRDKVVSKFETVNATHMTFDNKNGHFEFERTGPETWKQVLAKGQKAIQPLDIPKVRGILGSASSLNASDFAEPGVKAEEVGLGKDAALAKFTVTENDKPTEIVFRVGNQKDSLYYLQREGVDTIYLVSAWLGGRLAPKADDFIKKDPPKTPAPAAANGPAPAPGGGGQQLDPKLMQEIQRQIQQQQMQGH